MKVYMVVESLGYTEERNIACFGTEEEAKAFIEKHKDDDTFTSLTWEEWEFGKTINDY